MRNSDFLNFDRGKPVGVGVGQEFGGTEAVHEFLVDVELQIGDSIPDIVNNIETVFRGERQGGSAQGAVAQRMIALRGQIGQHADGDGRLGVDE